MGQFKPSSQEYQQLQREQSVNYVEHTIGNGPLPFPDEEFSGVLCAHVVEHFPASPAVTMLADCRRVLKPGGVLVVSVPDAGYFRDHAYEDTKENAVAVFGEPIHTPGKESFRSYAVFLNNPPGEVHVQVLSEDAVWLMLVEAGFARTEIRRIDRRMEFLRRTEAYTEIEKLLNRRIFSCEMAVFK